MDQSDIKALAPTTCPHCKGQIVVEFKSTAPQVIGVFTSNDLNTAKERTIQRVTLLPLAAARKEQIMAWLRDPDVIFSPNDIDTILSGIINENDIAKEDTAA